MSRNSPLPKTRLKSASEISPQRSAYLRLPSSFLLYTLSFTTTMAGYLTFVSLSTLPRDRTARTSATSWIMSCSPPPTTPTLYQRYRCRRSHCCSVARSSA